MTYLEISNIIKILIIFSNTQGFFYFFNKYLANIKHSFKIS